MSGQGQLAIIVPIEGSSLPGFGGGRPQRPEVAPPIVIPPLPPEVEPPAIWPPQLPEVGGGPVYPIVVPPPASGGTLPVLPGRIWPPLNPADGVDGKALLLVWIVGTDRYRWVMVDLTGGGKPGEPGKPVASPK